MACVICEYGIGDGWDLADGRFACSDCVTECTYSSCGNLAHRKDKATCNQCWKKRIKEEDEWVQRRYEKNIIEWKENGAKPGDRPKFKRWRDTQCLDCMKFLVQGKCVNMKNCNIANTDLLVRKKEKQLEIEKSMNEFFSILVQSLDGFFEWPSTESSPNWIGSPISDTNGSAEESPLLLLGYNVNQRNNLAVKKRKSILAFAFNSSRLPWVKDQKYMIKWGPASSPNRLKRIANHLAMLGRSCRQKKHDIALSRYDEDLDYLKEEFYEPMFGFHWPGTDEI